MTIKVKAMMMIVWIQSFAIAMTRSLVSSTPLWIVLRMRYQGKKMVTRDVMNVNCQNPISLYRLIWGDEFNILGEEFSELLIWIPFVYLINKINSVISIKAYAEILANFRDFLLHCRFFYFIVKAICSFFETRLKFLFLCIKPIDPHVTKV